MIDPLNEDAVNLIPDDLSDNVGFHNLPPELAKEQASLEALEDEVPRDPSPLRRRYLVRIGTFLVLGSALVGVTLYGMALRPFLTVNWADGISAWTLSGVLAGECIFAALIYAEAYVLAMRHER